MVQYRRDRLTWLAYAMLAWFAYLQAAPGLIVPHLRDELGLTYSAGGLQLGAFAAGSVVAGLTAGPLERALGRRPVFWGSSSVLAAGTVVLTLGHVMAATVGALFVMGCAGAILLITIQATLADRHGERRAIALSEANVAASVAYVVLIGALSLAAATGAGWRAAVLGSLAVPAIGWWLSRREPIDAPPPPPGVTGGRLPGAFWVATGMMFCSTAAEWCVTAWGASFVKDAAHVSVDTAVSLMIGYFGGVLIGRTLGSALARRHSAHRLLALALVVSAAGFAILWPSASPVQALAGLTVIGVGLGNLFPLGLAVTVSLAPDHAQLASGRTILVGSAAVLLAPLVVGGLADATSITAALGIVVPLTLSAAAAGLTLVTRAHNLRGRELELRLVAQDSCASSS